MAAAACSVVGKIGGVLVVPDAINLYRLGVLKVECRPGWRLSHRDSRRLVAGWGRRCVDRLHLRRLADKLLPARFGRLGVSRVASRRMTPKFP